MSSTILVGDALERLRELPDESVQCVVTSPPYWGLRDYGVDGAYGLEPTLDEYIELMVEVFSEVRRVLRKDGTLWLNLGDVYAHGATKTHSEMRFGMQNASSAWSLREQGTASTISEGLKPKDLIGLPWRVAFALQEAGWYLRCDVVWAKPNPMPESVRDRPTRAHEYVFLLTKSARYYYDADAIREASESGPSDIRKMLEGRERIGGKHKSFVDPFSKASSKTNIGQQRSVGSPDGRNKRSVWTIATHSFSGAHFATFPPALVEPCILAGSRSGDTILDPFCGSGTTGLVASRLGRKFVGIELNPEYAAMAERRIREDAPLVNEVEVIA